MKQTAVEFLVDNLNYYYSLKWNDILDQAKEIEKQQQDKFAIGFAEWLLIEPEDDSMEKYTTKELLEIYKKK